MKVKNKNIRMSLPQPCHSDPMDSDFSTHAEDTILQIRSGLEMANYFGSATQEGSKVKKKKNAHV